MTSTNFNVKSVEIQRSNVTVAEFFNYIKKQCEKKGLVFGLENDRDIFENVPDQWRSNTRYYVKDGVKYCTVDGHRSEWPAEDVPCKSEIVRQLPYDFQTYILNFDGTCYNETCEFHFMDDNRGFGYYYQMSKDIA